MSLNKTALSDQVADELLKIINSEYGEGDKIPNEMQLAARMNVSRTTIREAIKFLCAMNVVEIRRGKGTFVCGNPGLVKDPLGYRFLEKKKVTKELLEMNLIFAPEIAALAALKATPETIDKLREASNKVKDSLEEFEGETIGIIQLIQLEMDFHECIARSCDNSMIVRIAPIIAEGLKELCYSNASLITRFLGKYHEEMIEAITNRDADKARTYMKKYLLTLEQRLA